MKILLVGCSFLLLELVCARYACSVVLHGFALQPGSAFELWGFHDLFGASIANLFMVLN